ncbi:MAG: SUMF1/EgtB/PvdO family nonheme iron enzyme [Pseudomonadota bacterium]
MADVFLSYKREDRERIEPVVSAVEEAGFSVWWDDRITPHGEWDDTIARELEAAKAVVVIWTEASVASKWVRTEAHFANEQGKLVPVQLDQCRLPISFMLNQTADISSWNGDRDHSQWRKLLAWIEELSRAVPKLDQSSESDVSLKQWRHTFGTTEHGEIVFDGATITRRTAGGTFFRDSEEGPLMCVLPAGSYAMGSPDSDPDKRDSELPRHVVEFRSPFAIGVYPVTFEEWDTLVAGGPVGYSPADGGWGRGTRPAINVSWEDTQPFLGALAELTGEKYRLPSEAEWEYACRAGSAGPFAFDQGIDPASANFAASQPESTTAVGLFPSNKFGLFDMHGNVREWVEDLWHNDYAGAPADGLPWTSGHGAMHVVRGGSWLDSAWFLRSAARGRGGSHDRTNFIGFRVARDVY